MFIISDYEEQIMREIDSMARHIAVRPLNLLPAGGFISKLPQSQISFDPIEASEWTIPASGITLITNLNRIRYRLDLLESGIVASGSGHIIEDEGTPLTNRSKLNFVGDGVTVTDDLDNNATIVTIIASSGGAGVTDHGALTGLLDDDHTQYQLRSEKSSVSGYASLDGNTKVPFAELPTGTTSSQVAIGNHSHTFPSGGGHTIQDEGVSLTPRTYLNFVGSGVIVTDDSGNDATLVTIAGGTGTSGVSRSGTTTSGHLAVWDGNNTDLIKDGGTAPSAGALVLLEQHTASNSASLAFTCINSTYDDYVIEVLGIRPDTNAVDLYCQVSADGGANYDTGSNYAINTYLFAVSGNAGVFATTSAFKLRNNGEIGNSSAYGISGSLKLFTPASTTQYKHIMGQIFWIANGGVGVNSLVSWTYVTTTTTFNAFKFYFSSGNIAEGTIRVYGIVK